MKPVTTNSLSALGYVGLFLLFSMPYVGTPALILFAIFGHGEAKSFARALILIYVIFVALRKSDPDYEFKASMIFAAIFLFSVIYGVFFSLLFLINKAAKTGEKKKTSDAKSGAYKPRFK